jgi:hypothetical protein
MYNQFYIFIIYIVWVYLLTSEPSDLLGEREAVDRYARFAAPFVSEMMQPMQQVTDKIVLPTVVLPADNSQSSLYERNNKSLLKLFPAL